MALRIVHGNGMKKGTDTMLQFEEVYIPPTEDLNSEQSTLPVPPA